MASSKEDEMMETVNDILTDLNNRSESSSPADEDQKVTAEGSSGFNKLNNSRLKKALNRKSMPIAGAAMERSAVEMESSSANKMKASCKSLVVDIHTPPNVNSQPPSSSSAASTKQKHSVNRFQRCLSESHKELDEEFPGDDAPLSGNKENHHHQLQEENIDESKKEDKSTNEPTDLQKDGAGATCKEFSSESMEENSSAMAAATADYSNSCQTPLLFPSAASNAKKPKISTSTFQVNLDKIETVCETQKFARENFSAESFLDHQHKSGQSAANAPSSSSNGSCNNNNINGSFKDRIFESAAAAFAAAANHRVFPASMLRVNLPPQQQKQQLSTASGDTNGSFDNGLATAVSSSNLSSLKLPPPSFQQQSSSGGAFNLGFFRKTDKNKSDSKTTNPNSSGRNKDDDDEMSANLVDHEHQSEDNSDGEYEDEDSDLRRPFLKTSNSSPTPPIILTSIMNENIHSSNIHTNNPAFDEGIRRSSNSPNLYEDPKDLYPMKISGGNHGGLGGMSTSSSTHSMPACRICQLPAMEPNNQLISPCRCLGSIRYVHNNCLLKWLEVSSRRRSGPPACELCQYQYVQHKKFVISHWRFPECSLKDKILHIFFILFVFVMVGCAAVTILCFKEERWSNLHHHQLHHMSKAITQFDLRTGKNSRVIDIDSVAGRHEVTSLISVGVDFRPSAGADSSSSSSGSRIVSSVVQKAAEAALSEAKAATTDTPTKAHENSSISTEKSENSTMASNEPPTKLVFGSVIVPDHPLMGDTVSPFNSPPRIGGGPIGPGEIRPQELISLFCAIIFFSAFFLAMYVELKAKHTVYQLVCKFFYMNHEWSVEEYDRRKDVAARRLLSDSEITSDDANLPAG